MARNASPLTLWCQYLAARVAAAAVTSLDVDAALRLAGALGRRLYRIDHRHRQRALEHLRWAFPEYSDQQTERLAQASFEHLVKLVMEVCHTPRVLHADSWPCRLRLGTIGPALELLNRGQATIMLTGHLGNWEVLGFLLAVLGFPVDALARPLDNRLINEWLTGIRQRRGLRLITKWDATERMLQVIERGGTLGFIADQNAGDKGLFVPFFGRLASTYKSIGLLAMHRQVPIVCGYARRVGPGYHYELGTQDIIHPQDWVQRRDPLYYITARYMKAIEDMIRACPAQYLWMHRRWKSRPAFERRGQPIPDSLRRNLEELPWMNQSDLARIMRCPAAVDGNPAGGAGGVGPEPRNG